MSPDSAPARPFQEYESEKLMRRIEREPLPANVGALLKSAAEKYGDHPVLNFFDDGVTLSYRELEARTRKLVSALAKLGIKHGTHVGIMVYTSDVYPTTWLALARGGQGWGRWSTGQGAERAAQHLLTVGLPAAERG